VTRLAECKVHCTASSCASRMPRTACTHQVHAEWRVCACLRMTCKCQCLKHPCTCRRCVLVNLQRGWHVKQLELYTSSAVAQAAPRGRGTVQSHTSLCLLQLQTSLCQTAAFAYQPRVGCFLVWLQAMLGSQNACACETVARRESVLSAFVRWVASNADWFVCVCAIHAFSSQSHGLCGAGIVDFLASLSQVFFVSQRWAAWSPLPRLGGA
jgi:hypothetical protein